MASPGLYATFLLWLLSELFEELPEVGNPDNPKLVFFFDEAHLLFEDAPLAGVNLVLVLSLLNRLLIQVMDLMGLNLWKMACLRKKY